MSTHANDWSTGKTLGVWALQILVGLAFLAAGGSKLMGAESMVELYNNIGIGQWFRYVTGLLEVTGAGLVFVPKTAAIGGALLACIMIGAIVTHLALIGGSFAAPAGLLVMAALVAWFRRP